MAGGGWLPLDLSLATAGAGTSSASAPSAGTERRAETGTGTRAHRRSVSALFAELGAMLPNDLPTNRAASQGEIVDAAVKRVRMLEEAAAVLETYRAARAPPPRPQPRPEVAVAVATVCFSARLPAPTTPGSLTRVLEAFHRRGVEVLVATVARQSHGHAAAVVTVTASAAPPEVLELIRADIAAIH